MTENQEKRKFILGKIEILLSGIGYKRKGETFIKETEAGLFQIIEFSLAPKWSIWSGHIRLEFGVFSQEWNEYFDESITPKKIRTSDCELRDCYCSVLQFGDNINWFNLDQPADGVADSIKTILQNTILPYLNNLNTRTGIMDYYLKAGKGIGLPPRHRLSVGILYLGMGNIEKAIEIINNEQQNNSDNEFYTKVCKAVMAKFS